MPSIDRFDWLETYVAVANLESFSRAANYLHCSQSRVSIHISQLEKSVGHQLIDRSKYPISLTGPGRVFLKHARQIMESLTLATDEMEQLSDTIQGHLIIGTVPSISAMFLPQLLNVMKKTFPYIRIDISERTTEKLLTNLLDGSVDIAIRCDNVLTGTQSSSVSPLWGEPIVAVFPSDHQLAQTREPLNATELNQFEVGTTGAPGIGIDPDMRKQFDQWGVHSLANNYFTEQPQTLLNMAKVGIVVPVINLLAFNSCNTNGLTYRVINDDLVARRVFLQWNPAKPFSAAVQACVDEIHSLPLPQGTVPITLDLLG